METAGSWRNCMPIFNLFYLSRPSSNFQEGPMRQSQSTYECESLSTLCYNTDADNWIFFLCWVTHLRWCASWAASPCSVPDWLPSSCLACAKASCLSCAKASCLAGLSTSLAWLMQGNLPGCFLVWLMQGNLPGCLCKAHLSGLVTLCLLENPLFSPSTVLG
jgi:hypothetical protein